MDLFEFEANLATEQVPGHPGLCRKILSQKNQKGRTRFFPTHTFIHTYIFKTVLIFNYINNTCLIWENKIYVHLYNFFIWMEIYGFVTIIVSLQNKLIKIKPFKKQKSNRKNKVRRSLSLLLSLSLSVQVFMHQLLL